MNIMKWDNDSDKLLIDLVKNGNSRIDISNKMGITFRSIDSRCYRLKIKIKKPEYFIETICLKCGIPFKSLISEKRKFCSHSCNAKYNLPNRILSDDTKNKIRNSLTGKISTNIKERSNCLVCGEKVKKNHNIYCSIKCRNTSEIVKEKIRKKTIERYKLFPDQHPNRRCAGINETYPEKFFRTFLIKNGMIENEDFYFQYPIEKYFVDFYFPIINTCVEIDGERWHNKEDEKEILRETIIRKYFKMLRFDVKPLLKKEYETIIIDLIKETHPG